MASSPDHSHVFNIMLIKIRESGDKAIIETCIIPIIKFYQLFDFNSINYIPKINSDNNNLCT